MEPSIGNSRQQYPAETFREEVVRAHGSHASMTIGPSVLVLNPHAPLVQAAELQRPELRVPDSVVDLLQADVLAGAAIETFTRVLVTHALTVRPLIGILPDQAETLVLKPMPGSEPGAHVVGRIAAPQ